jgi:hypothetical protein
MINRFIIPRRAGRYRSVITDATRIALAAHYRNLAAELAVMRALEEALIAAEYRALIIRVKASL